MPEWWQGRGLSEQSGEQVGNLVWDLATTSEKRGQSGGEECSLEGKVRQGWVFSREEKLRLLGRRGAGWQNVPCHVLFELTGELTL